MASWLTMPASTLIHSVVCPRASDRKSGETFFRGKYLRGGSTPLLLAQAPSLHLGTGVQSVIVQPATILPRAVLLALRQMKAITGRIPDYQPSGTSA